MGLLEEWDRRNQRTAEWQRHGADERLKNGTALPWPFLVGLGLSVALVRHVLSRYLGFGWTMTILLALAVGCFAGEVVRQRRKRRAWEASQGDTDAP